MILDTDIINIVGVTIDKKFGNITKTVPLPISCRVEDTNKTGTNQNGKSVAANALILMKPDVAIKKADRVIIVSQIGVPTDDTREYEVIQVFTAGGFSATHKEVLI